jgi:hypothetical protein
MGFGGMVKELKGYLFLTFSLRNVLRPITFAAAQALIRMKRVENSCTDTTTYTMAVGFPLRST